MPSSHWNQIETIIDICRKLDPKRVVDIGCGFGKFGFLLREYLDVWKGRYHFGEWQVIIDAVEPHKEYIGVLQKRLYNFIFYGTAQNFFLVHTPSTKKSKYDLGLFIDVIEHLDTYDATFTLERALKCCKSILVVTPKKWYPQDEEIDWEKHRSHWQKKDFKKMGKCQFFRNNRALIVLINAKVSKHEFKKRLRNKLALLKKKAFKCPNCKVDLTPDEFVLRPDNILIKGFSCGNCLGFFEGVE